MSEHTDNSSLARAMGPVARELLGEPNAKFSSKVELRFGSRGSMTVDLTKGIWFDHEAGVGGGVLDLLRLKRGLINGAGLAWLEERGLITGRREEQAAPPPWERPIAATYPYQNAERNFCYEKVRFSDGLLPRFVQRQPKPGGRWIWNLAGLTPIPYRLPELLEAIAAGETIFFAEGEKDVAALVGLGLVATTTGSSSSWSNEQAPWFNGADVVILPDADEAGSRHAQKVAAGLAEHARRVRVLPLPGLPQKGDPHDWVEAGGTAQQLEALAAAAKDATPSSSDLAAFLSAEAWAAREFPAPVRLLGDVVTKTSRVFLIGMTGLGKTMLGIAMGAAMATGTDFLGWRCDRPVKVLYVDGEMPGELIKARILDAMRRLDRADLAGNLFFYSADMGEQTAAVFPGLGEMQPLNTEAGQGFVHDLIEKLGGVDVVIFDNVMSLIAGDQKEEVPWSETLPLISGLTRKQIGQIWLDHTGHNTARQYGSSTKAWRFDAVGIMTELPEDQRNERETAFKLSFDAPGKARRRTPDNWADFAARTVRLTSEGWESEAAGGGGKPDFGKVPPSREVFYEALLKAITWSATGPGAATIEQWQDECVRQSMLEPASSCLKEAERMKSWRRAKSDLIGARWISVDGEVVRDLKHQHG